LAQQWGFFWLGGKKLILAPLVGGSDLTFRLLCRKYGAELTFTEMIQAKYFMEKDLVKKGGSLLVEFHESDRPLILQVAATVDEADAVIEMVNSSIFKDKIDGVDLNCGCPQGFAMKRGIGSALFRHADA
jgi:tRNA-dihydrouridine synthase